MEERVRLLEEQEAARQRALREAAEQASNGESSPNSTGQTDGELNRSDASSVGGSISSLDSPTSLDSHQGEGGIPSV